MANQSPFAILQSAQDKVADGNQMGAIWELEEGVLDFPDEGRLWEFLGICRSNIGKASEAIAAFEQAMLLVPLSPDTQLALGLAYESIGKQSLACELLLPLAEEDDLLPSPDLLGKLARALGRLKKYSQALSVCQQATEDRPFSIGPLLGIVFYMTRLDLPSEEMLPSLFRALHLEPNDCSLRILLARRLHDCDMSADAAKLLQELDEPELTCPSCINVMQEIYKAANDTKNAMRYQRLLTVIQEDNSQHDTNMPACREPQS